MEIPVPKRPFRDSAIVYAVLSVVFVLIVWWTGGNVRVAVPVAIAFFVVATGYAWWRFRQQLAAEREEP
jgi:nicotinamide riboside transporter PnuC